MIATVEHVKLLEETDNIIEMLADSDLVRVYKDRKAEMAEDDEVQVLIKQFTKLREKYDEVQRFGKYHPDYNTVINEMMNIKRELDMNETISAYKKAEEEVNSLLAEIGSSLAGAVSPSIKVPTGDPFFDRGLGGGCGTGGACGCH